MSVATDGTGSGSAEPDWDEAEFPMEEFEAMLDAVPTVERLSERLAGLQRRVQEGREGDGLARETREEIEAELEDIQEQVERLPF